MMALAEFARREHAFDWVATQAVRAAGGSRAKLFGLVYAAGILTTAFLSNDATIVVLTPAVLAALALTGIPAEPYVVACAFVANAASTLLPIANPSNLLFFADGMPPLHRWFASFGVASLAALAATYAVLFVVYRDALRGPLVLRGAEAPPPRLAASTLLVVAALVLVGCASVSAPLGTVAFGLGVAAALLAATRERAAPLAILRGISWRIIALTAVLFVVVDLLDGAGLGGATRALFVWAAQQPPPLAKLAVAAVAALASNVVNNLPVGLELGKVAAASHPPAHVVAAALVGVNVGPNLTATGSLATLLWLSILKRRGLRFSARRFVVLGILATPPALALAALTAR